MLFLKAPPQQRAVLSLTALRREGSADKNEHP